MHLTKVTFAQELGGQAGDSTTSDGKVEVYRGRGVWVPTGLTAEHIMVGADVLERQYGVEPYTSRNMVIAVLLAIKASTEAET